MADTSSNGRPSAFAKSLDRKLAAIHADPNCREFILADAKDADMALGLGAPGLSPEAHPGEVRFKTLEEYREQMRLITRQGLVDIMLMSASSNYALTLHERLFDHSHVTPAVRANDTTDIHLARGASYAQSPARPFRTMSIDHAMCGHLDCAPEERTLGADLGLYSVTFNNDLAHDLATLERFHAFREEAERKGFRYFLEVFDPNVPNAVAPEALPSYINDMISRMLAGVAPAGRPLFLKMVYHGPRAMEEFFRFDPHLVIGILGGSAGTTRDAFQLLHDAQKYGAKVALFGRKINHAENQLAFVQFLRLIVDGVIGPAEAVKAYHAVLQKLGIPPRRSLDDDIQVTETAMSYAGTSATVTVPPKTENRHRVGPSPVSSNGHACACHDGSPRPSEVATAHACRCEVPRAVPSVGASHASQPAAPRGVGMPTLADGRPDFARMDVAQRLEYHRQRLGLGL
jgi:hypothetical protein